MFRYCLTYTTYEPSACCLSFIYLCVMLAVVFFVFFFIILLNNKKSNKVLRGAYVKEEVGEHHGQLSLFMITNIDMTIVSIIINIIIIIIKHHVITV